MEQQILTIEDYEKQQRHRYYLDKLEHQEQVVKFLWKLKQTVTYEFTKQEAKAIDDALEKAEHKAYFYHKKSENVYKYSNIQKYNKTRIVT